MAGTTESEQFRPASGRIQTLYREGLSEYLSGQTVHETSIPIPKPVWKELAEEFPEFGEKILDLGNVVSYAEAVRDHRFHETEKLRSLYFVSPEGDKAGQYLMAEILHSRIDQGLRDIWTISPSREAHAMLKEYGYEDGLLTDGNPPWIYLVGVIERVLAGSLKVPPLQSFKLL